MTGNSPHVLLVAATAPELSAALRFLPGGQAPPLSPDCGRPAPPPELPLPGGIIRLLVCGVGPVAAASALGRFLGQARAEERLPAGVINVGIAGSYDAAKAPLGSVLLACAETFPEYGVWPETDEEAEEQGARSRGPGNPLPLRFPQTTLPSGAVFDHLALAPDLALGNMGLNCHSGLRRGTGVTVAGVSGTKRRAGRLAALTGGLMENMEGFALALGCLAIPLPFAEIRAVSNTAGCRPPLGWDTGAALSALGQATRVLFDPWL